MGTIAELGHAGVARELTTGEVVFGVRVTGGHCEYDPETLEHPRAEATIAAAGPLASLLSCSVLTTTSSRVLAIGALVTVG